MAWPVELQPNMKQRMRWRALLLVPLIVLAVVLHSAVLTPLIGVVILVIAAWVLRARY
jgi:hypothetical protein